MNDVPPILPEVEDDLKQYLICPERLPIHQYERNQEYWPRKPNIIRLFNYVNSSLSTTLKVSLQILHTHSFASYNN